MNDEKRMMYKWKEACQCSNLFGLDDENIVVYPRIMGGNLVDTKTILVMTIYTLLLGWLQNIVAKASFKLWC